MWIFGGGVITKSDYFFFFWGGGGGRGRGSLLYILGLFKIKIQNGNIFLGRKFQIFLGMPDIYIYTLNDSS